jgi:signal peptidase I
MGWSSATLPSAATSQKIAPARPEPHPREGHRDTVEAIVVAFILALVVRGFEAQAFVIPTGSMAPTLMGRHKEIACRQCGFVYAVNASEEVEPRVYPRAVSSGICVNCRYQDQSLEEAPSFKGDRILVMMFPYDLPELPGSGPPERWDVVVFRYPEEPEVSYIKRLVGLPGETIRIAHGDIYVKSPGRNDFVRARKPLRHQSAMQINVYDDRYRPRGLSGLPEWTRWRPGPAWNASGQAESRYRAEAAGDSWSELRYHHLVPDPEQWDAVLNGRELPRPPRSTLITDFYSYNTNLEARLSDLVGESHYDQEGAWMQPHWVGDLTMKSIVEVKQVNPGGSVRWELVKGGIPHRCTIDLTTGVATFTRGEDVLGRGDTSMKGKGRYLVEFGNVDDRMTLAIDGRAVGEPGFDYETGEANPIPTAADLAPAALAVRDATVEASDLVLKRDIYYTQYPGRFDYEVVWDDRRPRNPTELFDFLSEPSRFSGLGRLKFHDYLVRPDRFFMLGDNSPRSKDSRGWGTDDARWDNTTERQAWEVPRHYLTGKAFYVYWPHGVPFGPEGLKLNRDTRLLFRPYVERMKWIR